MRDFGRQGKSYMTCVPYALYLSLDKEFFGSLHQQPNMGRDQILSTAQVDRLLAEGHSIVILEKSVLQLDNWLDDHPGGRLTIMHMVGRDATNEINVYHSTTVIRSMQRYRIGKLAKPWVNRTPPIRGGDFGSPYHTDKPKNGSVVLNEKADIKTEVKAKNYKGLPANPPAVVQLDPAKLEFVTKTIQDEVDVDLRDYPSLDAQTQHDIEMKYKALHQRVHDEGFYQCRYSEYVKELVRYTLLFASFAGLLYYKWYCSSAVMLGLFWHQIMFTAHDAGHRGITHNFEIDSLIGIFIGDFCCGLSIGWWKSSHNVHHLITNHPVHDPDIQNVPLFATCPSFFKSIHSSYYDFQFAWDKVADFAVVYQKYTYYPVMALARFNLYILSIHHLLTSPSPPKKIAWVRKVEITSIVCYWFLYGYCLVWKILPDWPTRIAFVLISHCVTMPLHVQITLSHWGMSTADLGEGESFPQRQLRTTMDVDCPQWLDWIHGGLQFQAVHHLFPRVPRHNLRALQALVREFCQETKIKYSILGFFDGNRKVLGRLDEVTAQLELMLMCQKHMAETGESGLH